MASYLVIYESLSAFLLCVLQSCARCLSPSLFHLNNFYFEARSHQVAEADLEHSVLEAGLELISLSASATGSEDPERS